MNLFELLKEKKTHISDESYRNYADYYNMIEKSDPEFEKKVSKIYDLIINEKVTDIEFIANDSNCTYEECILKIKYLKNKRLIGDYYIDVINKEIKMCNEYDRKLLEKYNGYIYNKHYQIEEIALKLYTTTMKNFEEAKQIVLNEILYLYNKNLLNGILINKIDNRISYYTLDKKLKNVKDIISIKCPNCGSENDIQRYGKTRCPYCNTIIEDKVV